MRAEINLSSLLFLKFPPFQHQHMRDQASSIGTCGRHCRHTETTATFLQSLSNRARNAELWFPENYEHLHGVSILKLEIQWLRQWLQCPYLISEHLDLSLHSASNDRLLLIHILEGSHPSERPGLTFGLLALAWPALATIGIWGMN